MSEIMFEKMLGAQGNLGIITLNRQKALNALNHAMFLALDEHISLWENDDSIKAVIIRATEGRAFCAGGDVRHAYERGKLQDPALPRFFYDEYRMNQRIHHYSKPYIALLNGITMGGGVGISIHGSHRVATENLIWAMPETTIGFFPDVGASYFLSRLPYRMGFYLGLTGVRITSTDCVALGIASDYVVHDLLPKLMTALAEKPFEGDSNLAVSTIISTFSSSPPDSSLLTHQHEIQECFSKNTIEEIIHALETHTMEWCQQTAILMKTKSPTSLKVTLKELQEGERLDFNTCMRMEYRLMNRFLQHHDFYEGVRAAIIDKDQSPHWKPAALNDVDEQDVLSYFAPLEKELS